MHVIVNVGWWWWWFTLMAICTAHTLQVTDLPGLQVLTPSSWRPSCRKCHSSRLPHPPPPRVCPPPPRQPPVPLSQDRRPSARNATAARQVHERGVGGGGGGCQVLKFRLWPGLFQLQMTVYNQKCQYHHEHWVASYHSLHPSLKLHFVELIFARFCNIRVGYFYVIMRTTFATELWLCWKRVIKPNGAYPRCMLRCRCIDAESVTHILASNTPWSTFAVQ